ncbi:MAG: DinB family protein [Anaerolineae bacterium]|nr:DinB family protein [Anaerolineae bacterium]MCO5187565.1 DinB family protein [Anaerolineae bacterium]MCO5198527.1 DinB family protein [Anaerolineae bacterium]MCO5203894.1 DinB family protein [Anaerolineae bacterium]
MNPSQLCAQLAQQAETIKALTQSVSAESARWKPSPDSWSILEVVNHLLDEEREDFRVKVDILLHRPMDPWPPIDPEGWVTTRQYNERDFAESLAAFTAERERSLDWLQTLKSADWNAAGPAPWGGTIRAGDMLAAWVAHDLLHMRQLVELHYALTLEAAQPFGVRYAGQW